MPRRPDTTSPREVLESGQPRVEQEWLDAYYEGNAVIPQTQDGITICLLAKLLEDPQTNWRHFFSSKLSSEQIRFIGTMMNRMHADKDIPVAMPLPDGNSAAIAVGPERLQEIWEASVLGVRNHLYHYMGFADRKFKSYEWNTDDNIIQFLSDTNYADRVRLYREGMGAIKEALNEPPIQELLTEFREGFRDPKNRKPRRWENKYKQRFEGLLLSCLQNNKDLQLPPVAIDFLVKNIAAPSPD